MTVTACLDRLELKRDKLAGVTTNGCLNLKKDKVTEKEHRTEIDVFALNYTPGSVV